MPIHQYLIVPALAGALLMVGCSSNKVSDQAATVNGEPITREDVDFEVAAQPGAKAGDTATRNRVLSKIINRRLLADLAKNSNVDQLPDYAAAERKAREMAIVDLFSRQLVGAEFNPDERRIQAFIAKNPAKFGEREILALSQLRISEAGLNTAWLHEAKNIDDAAEILMRHGIKFERGNATADTGALPGALLQAVTKHPNDPFAVTAGGFLLVSQVVGREAAPLPTAEAKQVAIALIRREALETTVTAKLAEARSAAKIEYGAGFDAANTVTESLAD